MKIIKIEKEINSAKLFDELLKAKLVQPTQVDGTSPMQGNTLYLPDDADTVTIQEIIDVHNPTPDPAIVARQKLTATDIDMARITEDLIYTLITKGIIVETDLPDVARTKLQQRQTLRTAL